MKPQTIIFYKYGVVFSEINVQLNNEINLLPVSYSLLGYEVVHFDRCSFC